MQFKRTVIIAVVLCSVMIVAIATGSDRIAHYLHIKPTLVAAIMPWAIIAAAAYGFSVATFFNAKKSRVK